MTAKSLAKALVPPLLTDTMRRWVGRGNRFSGRPLDWAEASTMSTRYSSNEILARVEVAAREVVAGRAAYERDSVLFAEPDFRFPVVAALMHVAALNCGRLEVVDFGGSLGSTYWQCRPYLSGLQHVRWQVIEQPSFVAAGQQEFTTEHLSFAGSIAELATTQLPFRLVLASSVLGYVEDPTRVLDELAQINASHMLIDRTPLIDGPADHLCIQQVPKEVYSASYPCWIFSRPLLMARLHKHWRVVSEFACDEGQCKTDEGLPFEFRGIYLERVR